VRRLVELHGGEVEARSEGLGLGSEIVILLPVGPSGETISRHESGIP
jgi:signal transduction histidine kinase